MQKILRQMFFCYKVDRYQQFPTNFVPLLCTYGEGVNFIIWFIIHHSTVNNINYHKGRERHECFQVAIMEDLR